MSLQLHNSRLPTGNALRIIFAATNFDFRCNVEEQTSLASFCNNRINDHIFAMEYFTRTNECERVSERKKGEERTEMKRNTSVQSNDKKATTRKQKL